MQTLQRNESLDALRGFAILTMILSGSIAFGGILPSWMYHAQVPPPLHKFNPSIPGITWVDLVFPFFLFSMGAAIPLSLKKKSSKNASHISIIGIAARRYLLLVFFAIFYQHMKVWSMADSPAAREYALAILAFVLMFGVYFKPASQQKLWMIIKSCSYATAFFLLWYLPFNNKGFRLNYSDIIIIVLANMAFFGTLLWWFTRHRPMWRLVVLLLLAAMIITGKVVDGWTATVVSFSPAQWMYQFYYLKYLFIIIPGTFAGEWMMKHTITSTINSKLNWYTIGICCLLLIIGNLCFLFSRQLVLNLGVSVLLMVCLWQLIIHSFNELLKKFVIAGSLLLMLGLVLEASEGGIKKDPSTFSYYFVTSGLAFFMLIFLSIVQQNIVGKHVVYYLGLNGKNPMLAYVTGALVITPLLYFTQTQFILNHLNTNAFTGFMKGVLFTALVSLLTIFCSQRGWFWKT